MPYMFVFDKLNNKESKDNGAENILKYCDHCNVRSLISICSDAVKTLNCNPNYDLTLKS